MTEPREAARARVSAVLERIQRVELQVLVVARPDATRIAARDVARDAAIAAGRGQLLDEATAAAREATLRAFSRGGFSGTWAANDWSISVATAGDRAAAAAAFEEAVIAAVVEDLVDDDTLETLRATTNELDRSTGMPSPGALSSFTATALSTRNPIARGVLVMFVIMTVVGFLLVGPPAAVLVAGVAIVMAVAARRPGRPGQDPPA